MALELFNKFYSISSLDEEQIEKIKSRLPEFKRGKSMIGHSTSQTSYSLQTMQMLSDSPLSRMKQCLAQINKRYEALTEVYYKMEKKKLALKRLENNTDANSRLTVEQYKTQLESIGISFNSSLKELGMFQDLYDSIKRNNNIPDNWSEKDYEKQEIENMIRMAFRLGIQDLASAGRTSKSFVEYMEQIGIHHQVAETKIREYLNTTQIRINNMEKVSIKDMYYFLDEMTQEFKDSYQIALQRIGLDVIGSDTFVASADYTTLK